MIDRHITKEGLDLISITLAFAIGLYVGYGICEKLWMCEK